MEITENIPKALWTKSCLELLSDFKERSDQPKGRLLHFSGVTKDEDVYNITAPFTIGDSEYIAGRVELKKAKLASRTMFFKKQEDQWIAAPEAPVFPLEDPFISRVGNELILGGVEILHKTDKHSESVQFQTNFYRGDSLRDLRLFAHGPRQMKDIRLVELGNGKVGVFTRPQGNEAGKGKIGFTVLSSLEELGPDTISHGQIIEGMFAKAEWGGANEPRLLNDGSVGVLGHIAYLDPAKRKHYYAMAFTYHPDSHIASMPRIIATRSNFPFSASKRPDLEDVIFPGGLYIDQQRHWRLFAGLGDAAAGEIILKDSPF